MISFDEIKKYLPQYLSPGADEYLFQELDQFPDNIDYRLYTTDLRYENTIYQGNGLRNLMIIDLPDTNIYHVNSVVISNTCDLFQENRRPSPSRLCYTPIVSLRKYEKFLRENGVYKAQALENHISAIKNQFLTQIFFLPKYGALEEDSIIFFDRIQNCDNESIDRSNPIDIRLFTLSNYGHYLFLFKFSMHFTRFTEDIDRGMAIGPN